MMFLEKNLCTTDMQLVSHILKDPSVEDDVKMPVSCGYHCTLDTAWEEDDEATELELWKGMDRQLHTH